MSSYFSDYELRPALSQPESEGNSAVEQPDDANSSGIKYELTYPDTIIVSWDSSNAQETTKNEWKRTKVFRGDTLIDHGPEHKGFEIK